MTIESAMTPSHHALRFLATQRGVEEAAASLRRFLDEMGLGAATRYNVELAFEEVAGNIMRHGSPASDVEFSIASDRREIVLTFDDDGVAFDPREQPEPPIPESIDDAVVGGLGLVLLRRIASRIDYTRTAHGRNHLSLAISTY